MNRKPLKTFYANIYMGLTRGYEGEEIDRKEVETYLSFFSNKHQIGITVTDTHFIYPSGEEKGVCLGIIDYPRYPVGSKKIRIISEGLVDDLLDLFDQERITVVYPDTTIMFERGNEDNNSGK